MDRRLADRRIGNLPQRPRGSGALLPFVSLTQGMEELIGNSVVSALAVTSEQTITLWNDEAGRLTDFTGPEVVGQPCWDVLAGRDEQGRPLCRHGCKVLLRAQFDRHVGPFNMLIKTKGGRDLWVNVVSLIIPSPRGERMTMFHLLQDIHRFKQAEQLTSQVLDAVNRLQSPTDGHSQMPRLEVLNQFQTEAREVDLLSECLAQPDERISQAQTRLKSLTAREREVLKLLCQGADTATVAEKLVISQTTARNYVQHILSKMGVRSRLEAALAALAPSH